MRQSADDAQTRKQEAKPEERAESVAKAVKKINAGRQEEDERVKAPQTATENPENTVYISADDVGVKRQKKY